jgi:hypothetical protein
VRLLRFGVLLAFSVAVVLIGCTAFGEDDSSRPPSDDAAMGVDGGGSDGPVDGFVPPVDSSVVHFCTSIDAAFCSDFDDGPSDASWTTFIQANASGTLEAMDASSPPNAFAVRIIDQTGTFDASGPTPGAYSILSRQILWGTNTKVAVDFDIRARTVAPPGEYMAVMSLILAHAPDRVLSITTNTDGTGLLVFDTTGLTVAQGAVPLPSGWVHVRLEADTSSKTATTYYDGVLAAKTTNGLGVREAGFTVDIGVFVFDATGSQAIDYDNVVVTLAP